MSKKKIGNYIYERSTAKNKKLMTIVNGKKVHFGDIRLEHFKDKTDLLPKNLNHGDKNRKEAFLKRSGGIKRKDGTLTKDDPTSPNYHSRRILW